MKCYTDPPDDDEHLSKKARLGAKRDLVAADRVDDLGLALIVEGEDYVDVPTLPLKVPSESTAHHFVMRDSIHHIYIVLISFLQK